MFDSRYFCPKKSDEDQDMVTERRKKRTNEQISDCEGKLNCKSMETNVSGLDSGFLFNELTR